MHAKVRAIIRKAVEMAEDQVKRRGRPPKDPTDRKDGNLTFRTRGSLRERLSAAATENGRSISEEVERRLEASFEGFDAASAVSAAARRAIDDAQDIYAIQAIHSTMEELQEDLGHPYALAVALYMGQGFTAAHEKIRAETPNEIWFDDPERMREVAVLMHQQVDAMFANWRKITFFTSFWNVFQKYKTNILRKSADGTYDRRADAARQRHDAEPQTQGEL